MSDKKESLKEFFEIMAISMLFTLFLNIFLILFPESLIVIFFDLDLNQFILFLCLWLLINVSWIFIFMILYHLVKIIIKLKHLEEEY